MQKTLHIFTASGCEPCEAVKDAMDKGNIELIGVPTDVEVELTDITSDDEFDLIEKYDLDGVPAAYLGTAKCEILFDDESNTYIINCADPVSDQKERDDHSEEQPGEHVAPTSLP